MKTMTNTLHKRQRGITLIESMVALVIAALGILGILGVQMRTLSDTSTTVRRAQAIRLIDDLGERMRTNPNAMVNLGSYVSNFATNPAVGSCASGCDHAALAAYDLAVWKQAVRNSLPLGQAEIFIPPVEAGVAAAQRRQLGVMISWRESEVQGKTTADTNSHKSVFAVSTKNAADQTIACPTDRICHLQFISPNQRCIPDAGIPAGVHCPTP